MVPCSAVRCPCTMAQYSLCTNRPSQSAATPRAASILFGHHHDAAGFAVETVHEVRMGRRAEMQTHAADEARIDIAFGGMADGGRRAC